MARISGFTFNSIDLSVWQDRAINGPYKTEGDRFAYSPGSWDDVVTRANKFMNDEVTEYWDGDINSSTTQEFGRYVLAAAFYGVVKTDDTYRTKAKNLTLQQAQNTTNPDFETLEAAYPFSAANVFHFASLMSRHFFVFDYTYDLWSASEITTFETWFNRGVSYWDHLVNYYPNLCYPNRASDDYSSLAWWAVTGEAISTPEYYYTHVDENGVPQNYTRRAHLINWNGTANELQCQFLWALYNNDQTTIDKVKRWVREWILGGTFTDGMPAESHVNGAYSRPSTGSHWYAAIMIEHVSYILEQLRRRGDVSLYEYSTDNQLTWNEGGGGGRFESTGITKNFRLIIDTLVALQRSTINRYWNETGDINSVNETNRLDPKNGTFRHRSEQSLPLANIYYRDNTILQTYKNQASGTIPYTGSDTGPFSADSKAMGQTGIFPAFFYNTTKEKNLYSQIVKVSEVC